MCDAQTLRALLKTRRRMLAVASMGPEAAPDAQRRSSVKRGLTENDFTVSASASTPTLSRRQKQRRMAGGLAASAAAESSFGNMVCSLCFVTSDKAEWANHDYDKQPEGHARKTNWQIYIAGHRVQIEFLGFA